MKGYFLFLDKCFILRPSKDYTITNVYRIEICSSAEKEFNLNFDLK